MSHGRQSVGAAVAVVPLCRRKELLETHWYHSMLYIKVQTVSLNFPEQ
jgi:hypothetical protein